ncbi:DoxX family protein [Streptomyces crystallinus]|uniref:DoxX family protein n=1 Tax=Streptomyces crystallinus TaxID=68191 RepID=UPI0031D49A76
MPGARWTSYPAGRPGRTGRQPGSRGCPRPSLPGRRHRKVAGAVALALGLTSAPIGMAAAIGPALLLTAAAVAHLRRSERTQWPEPP